MADRILYEDPPRNIEVRSLAPSDAAKTLALQEIGSLMPREGMPKRRMVARTPNENSVVLWIQSSERRVLLGADLETSANPAVGWTAIIESASSAAGRAEVFKVPHHGSIDADDPRTWREMLVTEPVAALSQFASGTRPLPSAEDVKRLLARTGQLYCTGSPTGWKPKAKDHTVEKTLRQVTRDLRTITGPMGHIRMRASLTGTAQIAVHLGNGALHLAA